MLKRSASAALLGIIVLAMPARAEETLDRVPDELRGVWGSDCSKPEMRFDERALHQFSDRSSSPVRKVVRRAGEIELHYDRPHEKLQIVDTFQVEGATLAHDAQATAFRTHFAIQRPPGHSFKSSANSMGNSRRRLWTRLAIARLCLPYSGSG